MLGAANTTAWHLLGDDSKLVIALACFTVSAISACCLTEEAAVKEMESGHYSSAIYEDV
jgi:hypothetical protein